MIWKSILWMTFCLISSIESKLHLHQMFDKCQISDLKNSVIIPHQTENFDQLYFDCQNVTHMIRSKQTSWLKCAIRCQAGYSLKNPHHPDLKIASSFFTCRKIKNLNQVYWKYQDGSRQPDLAGCQIDTCSPPLKLRKKFKKSNSLEIVWEARFYWVESDTFVSTGSLFLNLDSLRTNLADHNFSKGWTLILEFKNFIPVSNSNSYSIHISKALNIKSINQGQMISFTSNRYNDDILTSNSTHFLKDKRVKFEINFYAGAGQKIDPDLQVRNIYLLKGAKSNASCHILGQKTEATTAASVNSVLNNFQQCQA